MKIVCTSDWHLDAVTSGQRRESEVLAAIEQSVRVAIEERASLYVFGGDLCDPDGWNVLRAAGTTIAVANELRLAGIPSLWVAGNHDVCEDGLGTTTLTPLARAFENSAVGTVTVVEREPWWGYPTGDTEDPAFVVLPFTPRSHAYVPDAAVKAMAHMMTTSQRERCVVLGHLNIGRAHPGSETADMPRGREVFWPTAQLKRLLPKALLLGGHYHASQECDGVNIIGSLARLTHGEEAAMPSILVAEL